MPTSESSQNKASVLMKATEGLVALLDPLDSDDRKRAIQAALTLLGDTAPALKGSGSLTDDGENSLAVSPKARTWMKQNEINEQALEHAFHFEDGVATIIAGEMPGKAKKDKTLNAYILCGLGSFLTTGESKFSDKQARDLCIAAGCYDQPNHGRILKAKGNSFTGSKDKGWTLTAPGLKAAAKLVRDLAPRNE